jgi:hypothetical protein
MLNDGHLIDDRPTSGLRTAVSPVEHAETKSSFVEPGCLEPVARQTTSLASRTAPLAFGDALLKRIGQAR